MSPSSSMRLRAGLSAGAHRARRMPVLCSTRSNKHSAIAARFTAAASSITRIEAADLFRSNHERLNDAGVEPSVGSVGDSYGNALAETINGLYKAEVIWRRGPWRNFEAVEFATLEWVDWFNNKRLLEPIGNIPPAEAETRYYVQIEGSAWQHDSNQMASGKPGAVQRVALRAIVPLV